jgi:hypothetical protein
VPRLRVGLVSTDITAVLCATRVLTALNMADQRGSCKSRHSQVDLRLAIVFNEAFAEK